MYHEKNLLNIVQKLQEHCRASNEGRSCNRTCVPTHAQTQWSKRLTLPTNLNFKEHVAMAYCTYRMLMLWIYLSILCVCYAYIYMYFHLQSIPKVLLCISFPLLYLAYSSHMLVLKSKIVIVCATIFAHDSLRTQFIEFESSDMDDFTVTLYM